MAIQPIQLNVELNQPSQIKKKEHVPYLEAEGAVKTDGLVKPLPPKGHLIHDSFGNGVKYFFKDIGYDMKSVKNGFNGTANDHQLGRLNDVGLRIGGIGIAAYLASRTSNPKVRLMEYAGLITFLTAMSVYPKMMINTPAKVVNGFDIDKQYIDDQGRKKSVMQDGNYVPFDMYRGEVFDEDLDNIGDAMGVPRNIKNRHDVIREQMRKVSIQNNTLWMLTAGFATPLMSALACCGIEYLAGAGLEKVRNKNVDKEITILLEKTAAMNPNEPKSKDFGKKIEKMLKEFEGKELPESEFKNLVAQITEKMDDNVASGIKSDLEKILRTAANGTTKSVVLDADTVVDVAAAIKKAIPKKLSATLEEVIVPTKEEITTAIKKVVSDIDFTSSKAVSVDKLAQIRDELGRVLESKLANVNDLPKDGLNALKHSALDNIVSGMNMKKSMFLSKEALGEIVNFSNIIDEFKSYQTALDKCRVFKFEAAPETIIARSYGRFENALLKELGIPFKDLRKMRNSSDYTKEILDKKITELCKDEARYSKVMEKLGKIVSQMEVELNGSDVNTSKIQELINAIENNYNNTAIRLSNSGKFSKTIDRLVKEDVSTLQHTVSSREGLFDLLDGITRNPLKNNKELKELAERDQGLFKKKLKELSAKECPKGIGSSKYLEISRIIDRYSGAKNSFNRILHTLDFYKRAMESGEISSVHELADRISKMGKDVLLSATTSDHTLKLDTINAQRFYKEFMDTVYKLEGQAGTKSKGHLTDSTKKALEKLNASGDGAVLDRLQYYIARFKNLVTNYDVDFTKPKHIEDKEIVKEYAQKARTRLSIFNLVAQSPVDMAKGAAGRRYSNQKWLRIVGGLTAAVCGITVLSQFGFGRISNPYTLKKQVNNETDK